MRDYIETRWIAMTIAAGSYLIGWLFGSVVDGDWLRIFAWALAVFAAVLVVASVIEHGHRDEKLAHRNEMESARRRVREALSARSDAQQRADDAVKALAVANRLAGDSRRR